MNKSKINTRQMILCALFAALISVGTFLKIPGPVVPITMQFLFVNLAALVLGSRYGTISVAVYVALGLMGVPIFSGGGGIGYVLHPTFGYLIGFIIAAFIGGKIVENSKSPSFKTFLIAGIATLLVLDVIGMTYQYFLSNFYLGTQIGVRAIVIGSFVLTAPGDIILCVVSAFIARRLRPLALKRT